MEAILPYDEPLLLRKVAQGDEMAFTRLFHSFHDKLFSFILKITGSREAAEDVVQEVFMKIWLNRESLVSITNFNGYLFRMAQNQAINGLRRLSTELLVLHECSRNISTNTHGTEEMWLHKAAQESLREAINRLPPQQKLVYILSRDQGLKQEEIAGRLSISVSTVKNHMTQALKTLRKHMGDSDPIITAYLVVTIAFFLSD